MATTQFQKRTEKKLNEHFQQDNKGYKPHFSQDEGQRLIHLDCIQSTILDS